MPQHKLEAPRALVVDDDRMVRMILVRTLSAAGFVVEEGDTGAAALQLAQTIPDVVIVDINLPDLSGLNVCRALRASGKTADIGVVFLTGDNDSRTIVNAFAAGADDCLHKPVLGDVLVARVKRAVGHAEGRRALRRYRESVQLGKLLLDELEASTTPATRETAKKLRALLQRD